MLIVCVYTPWFSTFHHLANPPSTSGTRVKYIVWLQAQNRPSNSIIVVIVHHWSSHPGLSFKRCNAINCHCAPNLGVALDLCIVRMNPGWKREKKLTMHSYPYNTTSYYVPVNPRHVLHELSGKFMFVGRLSNLWACPTLMRYQTLVCRLFQPPSSQ